MFAFEETGQEDKRIVGELVKKNDLSGTEKLARAGICYEEKN